MQGPVQWGLLRQTLIDCYDVNLVTVHEIIVCLGSQMATSLMKMSSTLRTKIIRQSGRLPVLWHSYADESTPRACEPALVNKNQTARGRIRMATTGRGNSSRIANILILFLFFIADPLDFDGQEICPPLVGTPLNTHGMDGIVVSLQMDDRSPERDGGHFGTDCLYLTFHYRSAEEPAIGTNVPRRSERRRSTITQQMLQERSARL